VYYESRAKMMLLGLIFGIDEIGNANLYTIACHFGLKWFKLGKLF